MKILLVRTTSEGLDRIKAYNVQGIGLGSELAKRGHAVSLVYYAKDGIYRTQAMSAGEKQLTIYYIPGKAALGSVLYDSRIYQLCDNCDIIQISEYDQLASWKIYQRYPKKTIIYHGPYCSEYTRKHNFYVRFFDLLFLRNFYRKAPVIAKSVLAEQYLRRKRFSNVTTLGVGYNPDYMNNEETTPFDKYTLLQKRENQYYLLHVGELSARKNVLYTLKILHELKKQALDVVLLVVGRIKTNDQYYLTCMDYIHSEGLKENVIFCGQVEQNAIKYYYNIADAFILPTQYDIYGMVLLEAMYYGVPVITTLCGGSSTMIRDGENGFILDLKNICDWCSTIKTILQNKQLQRKISEESKKTIEERYLWSKLVAQFEKEYEKLLT